jgi:hypothetical protein
MKRALLAASAAIVGLAIASPGLAGEIGDGNPVYALHVAPHTGATAKICNEPQNPWDLDCASFTVAAPVQQQYDMYLVVAGIDSTIGYKGGSCGVSYNDVSGEGVIILEWHLCATLEFKSIAPAWPASGSGNLITWSSCQDWTHPDTTTTATVQSTLGAFYIYVYSNDSFQITQNTTGAFPQLSWANCAGKEDYLLPSAGGRADFGAGAPGTNGLGCNPCLQACPVPTYPTTWGKIKTSYE